MKFSHHKKNGFTLIEMMVAVFVFSVVMVLSTGAILSIISANKTSQALKSVMDNLSSALDSMSREIRYGTNYQVSNDNKTFHFLDKDHFDVEYFFREDSGSIDNSGFISRLISDGKYIDLTAPEVHITNLRFEVQNTDPAMPRQPFLLITISGYAMAGKTKSSFNIETMVSQRRLECKDVMKAAGISCE